MIEWDRSCPWHYHELTRERSAQSRTEEFVASRRV